MLFKSFICSCKLKLFSSSISSNESSVKQLFSPKTFFCDIDNSISSLLFSSKSGYPLFIKLSKWYKQLLLIFLGDPHLSTVDNLSSSDSSLFKIFVSCSLIFL